MPRGNTVAGLPWFSEHPVFRLADFAEANPGRSPNTIKSLLNYHVREGNLVRLRQGVYVDADFWDPWAIAGHLTADAVLAYDGALHLQRPWQPTNSFEVGRVSFLTANPRTGRFDEEYGRVDFNPVKPPKALGARWARDVTTLVHAQVPIRVTPFERTLVDLLDRMELAPPGLELWEAFVRGQPKPRALVRHARALGSKAAAARLGLFVEQLPDVDEADLKALERLRPSSPVYFDRTGRERQRFLRRWNLVVPVLLDETVTRTDFRVRPPRIPTFRY